MLKAKITSSLVKAFADEGIDAHKETKRVSALRGESVAFQLIFTDECGESSHELASLALDGSLATYTTARTVMNVPVMKPLYPRTKCQNFLRRTPGMYPDVLIPMHNDCSVTVYSDATSAIWFDIDIPREGLTGEQTLTVTLTHKGVSITDSITVDIIDALLPESELIFTEWFHCDSLANYYNLEPFSEEHWRVVENFARVAVRNGINLLLTPVFTPPLDTKIGGERRTTQLVGVELCEGSYTFDFTLLDRWCDMCNRIGVRYFEISHLFTQWGAAHAPKVMATVNGEYKRIFGWDTDAHGEEYRAFLRAFIKAFLSHMKERGEDKRCFFHISDEPTLEQLESYKASKAIVADLLEGYVIMDALSNYDFFEEGIVTTPIPATNHIAPFLEHEVKGLWTYYCCCQYEGTSNRFIAMPACRNRSIGMQLFKYDIRGFLHWGYNFYNNQHSRDSINPYLDGSGDNWVPAGDMFSVYPSSEGEALESTRIVVFRHALFDLAAMKLCERYYNKEEIIERIEAAFGGEIRFDVCATSDDQIHAVRETVNSLIREAISKRAK